MTGMEEQTPIPAEYGAADKARAAADAAERLMDRMEGYRDRSRKDRDTSDVAAERHGIEIGGHAEIPR
jgi:hypothetical protein